MILIFELQYSLYVIIPLLSIIFQTYYIIITAKQFVNTLKQYKKTSKLDSFQINAFVKYKLLYNQKTILIKSLFIIAILSFEIVTLIYIFTAQITFNKNIKHTYVINRVHMISLNCSVQPTLAYFYHYPASILLYVISGIMVCSMITLVSILTTFLKKRYYSHPLTTSLLRYTGWWCVQVFLPLTCCTIYTLPLFPIVSTSLAFMNWIYLIYESKQFVYILKSRIRDIVNYEWDRVHYIQSRDAYRMYVVFSVLYILAMFSFILVLSAYIWIDLIQFLLLDECFFDTVYKFKLNLHLSENFKDTVSRQTYNFETYILPWLIFISLTLLMSPFFVNSIWNRLRGCIKRRTTPIRYTPVYEQCNGHFRLRLKAHRRKTFCF